MLTANCRRATSRDNRRRRATATGRRWWLLEKVFSIKLFKTFEIKIGHKIFGKNKRTQFKILNFLNFYSEIIKINAYTTTTSTATASTTKAAEQKAFSCLLLFRNQTGQQCERKHGKQCDAAHCSAFVGIRNDEGENIPF